jgi:uncharacterized protein (DUF1499 family)
MKKGFMQTRSGRIFVMAIGFLGFVGCAGERPQNLRVREGALSACPSSPNCVSSQAVDDGHRIAPLTFNGNPEIAFARLKFVLVRRNDTTVVEDHAGYLQVELRTTLFVDDGEFLLDRTRKVIHIRSASRLGYSDLGKNRSRMEEIRSQFLSADHLPPL